jgi:hypothetical protein
MRLRKLCTHPSSHTGQVTFAATPRESQRYASMVGQVAVPNPGCAVFFNPKKYRIVSVRSGSRTPRKESFSLSRRVATKQTWCKPALTAEK